MANYHNNTFRSYKTVAIISVISIIFLWILFSGDEPVPVETSAIELGHNALRMLDEALASKNRQEITELLLTGIGYIISISAPAAVVIYFLQVGRKK